MAGIFLDRGLLEALGRTEGSFKGVSGPFWVDVRQVWS